MDINKERLLDSIFMLGKIGIDASGERTRLASLGRGKRRP